MKKLFFIGLFSLIMVFGSFAQDYKTGVGIRYGWGKGLTVKHFLGEKVALEGILNSQWKGFSLTGLLEFHKPLLDIEHLNWYYGGGGHIGWWDGKYDYKPQFDDGSNTGIGLVGVVGVELNLGFIPINFSVDWKPSLNLVGASGFWGDGGALSIRYIF